MKNTCAIWNRWFIEMWDRGGLSGYVLADRLIDAGDPDGGVTADRFLATAEEEGFIERGKAEPSASTRGFLSLQGSVEVPSRAYFWMPRWNSEKAQRGYRVLRGEDNA